MLSLYTGSSGPWGRHLTPVSFSMKRLGVLLLPPGWDASPLQGYPQHICWYPFVHLGEEKHCESKVSCLINNTTQWLRPGLELRPLYPESSALTMRPPHLHTFNKKNNLITIKKHTNLVLSGATASQVWRQLLFHSPWLPTRKVLNFNLKHIKCALIKVIAFFRGIWHNQC